MLLSKISWDQLCNIDFDDADHFLCPQKSRQELEQHSVDTASTSDAVNFITYVQTLKRKIKQFEKNVDVSTSKHLQECRSFLIISMWFEKNSLGF